MNTPRTSTKRVIAERPSPKASLQNQELTLNLPPPNLGHRNKRPTLLFTATTALPPTEFSTLSDTYVGQHFHHIKETDTGMGWSFCPMQKHHSCIDCCFPGLWPPSSLFGIVTKSNRSPVNAHRSFSFLSLCNAASAEAESFDVETQTKKKKNRTWS